MPHSLTLVFTCLREGECLIVFMSDGIERACHIHEERYGLTRKNLNFTLCTSLIFVFVQKFLSHVPEWLRFFSIVEGKYLQDCSLGF